MELHKVEELLAKYFDGETTLNEERTLKDYFTSDDVAPQFENYRSFFCYFNSEASAADSKVKEHKVQPMAWLSIAASIVLVLGVSFYVYQNQQQDTGTYDDPEVAFEQTQRALELLSRNVNQGVQSFEYVAEYEKSKDKIFK